MTEISSSFASSTSSAAAGISFSLSRHNVVTLPSVKRTAVRATSTATLPPPITTTSPSNACLKASLFALRKNSTPV